MKEKKLASGDAFRVPGDLSGEKCWGNITKDAKYQFRRK
jgi:hypothetical protein